MPRRTAISIEQKKELRSHKALNPSLSNKALKQWFEALYKQKIALSSVSEILSKRYEHLDRPVNRTSNQKRYRREHWPELETALYLWIQQAETSIKLSREVIRLKAEFFWKNLSVYKDREMPAFSNGWLEGFQKRRSIKNRIYHGEAGSAIDAEQQMKSIGMALQHYNARDIFNCDETGLLWKLVPDRGLSTRSLHGRKKEKAWITAHLCCNSDGSERLPIWFIGKAQQPHAFRAAGINIENLNLKWRHNKEAWMTGILMEEWLRWFDSKMAGRQVVLLMDNFSAHALAVENINKSLYPLRNTLIIWLPPNATSKYQPLDQGIIYSWKCHWKRQWIIYMIEEYESNRDPLTTMNVLKALRWGIQAWDIDMAPATIQHCFQRALFKKTAVPPEDLSMIQISNDFQRLCMVSGIRNPMKIENFLNPAEEVVEDSSEDLERRIIEQLEPEEPEDEEETINMEADPQISTTEALDIVKRLRLYEEQQDKGDTEVIQRLNHYERRLEARRLENQQRQDMTAYFVC
uniref:Centromere binding protein Cbh2 n=1 Tax=Coccidioides posadasii RMSCC 3488 TaxID=454284 RepID=A0A0J6FPF6_COCPO|nr:centromere binding protein Cbh2 [Coccidioides posadasii RMSCC 3488]